MCVIVPNNIGTCVSCQLLRRQWSQRFRYSPYPQYLGPLLASTAPAACPVLDQKHPLRQITAMCYAVCSRPARLAVLALPDHNMQALRIRWMTLTPLPWLPRSRIYFAACCWLCSASADAVMRRVYGALLVAMLVVCGVCAESGRV